MNKYVLFFAGLVVVLVVGLAAYNSPDTANGDPGTIEERTLTISPGKIIERDRSGNISILPDANFSARLEVQDFEVGLTAEHVEKGAALAFSRGLVRHKGDEVLQNLIGIVNDDFLEVYGYSLESGEFYRDDTDQNVIVIGQTIKDYLENEKNVDPIGQTLNVRGTKFKIIGVLNRINTGNQSADEDWNKLFVMPYGRSDPILESDPFVEEIRLLATGKSKINKARDEVTEILISNRGQEDFTVLTPREVSQIDSILGQ